MMRRPYQLFWTAENDLVECGLSRAGPDGPDLDFDFRILDFDFRSPTHTLEAGGRGGCSSATHQRSVDIAGSFGGALGPLEGAHASPEWPGTTY